jgi:molybdopterin-synthase adenylyltransferase
MDAFVHEISARGAETLRLLREARVTVCGAGAVGANLTETLARQGFARLRVIDRDRVEGRNLSTQPWERADIGRPKARILAGAVFRAVGAEVETEVAEIDRRSAPRLLRGSDVVVDGLDNEAGRRAVQEAVRALGIPCLHVGLAGGYAEAVWDENYRVPRDDGEDTCDAPLARNLIVLAAAVAAETLVRFIARGEKASRTITLEDLAIRPLDL